MRDGVGCDRCRIYWDGMMPPATCPNCGGPVPTPPPPPHLARGVVKLPTKGYVCWCSCGMGSPPKATRELAASSLQPHLDDPRVFPK